MKWVTRRRIRVNRMATAGLIRRFIDPRATFLFVEADEVAEVQPQDGAIGFDAPAATYPHCDIAGLCSFETLVEWRCPGDPALHAVVPGPGRLAMIWDLWEKLSLDIGYGNTLVFPVRSRT